MQHFIIDLTACRFFRSTCGIPYSHHSKISFKSGVNRVRLKDMLQQMKQITDVDQMVWILTLDEIAPLQTMDDKVIREFPSIYHL